MRVRRYVAVKPRVRTQIKVLLHGRMQLYCPSCMREWRRMFDFVLKIRSQPRSHLYAGLLESNEMSIDAAFKCRGLTFSTCMRVHMGFQCTWPGIFVGVRETIVCFVRMWHPPRKVFKANVAFVRFYVVRVRTTFVALPGRSGGSRVCIT